MILIPVIIHLFQLRKYKLVYFSSLKFLKQLDIEQKRKSRIRDLLLLLTRILLICMLVLAFAHPYFPDETNFDGRTQTVGIYIDNSLSMQNEIGGQSQFDHARSAAAALVDELPSDTRYYLLHNSDLFNSRFPLENKDVISNLEILRPSPASSDKWRV